MGNFREVRENDINPMSVHIQNESEDMVKLAKHKDYKWRKQLAWFCCLQRKSFNTLCFYISVHMGNVY